MKKNLSNLLQSLSLYEKKSAPGFTVLEFLIVLAIMLVLIAIALPGLQQSRAKAEDEKRITDLRTITLGLEQYKQICEEYPYSLDPDQSCFDSTLNLSNKNLSDYIPDLVKLNATGLFKYTPLSYSGGSGDCIGFHIGVTLRNEVQQTTLVGDQNFNSTVAPTEICSTASGDYSSGFDGNTEGLFDLHR